MNATQALKRIKAAIEASPRNGYIAEFHLQVIKYSEVLEGITGKEFCEAVGLTPAFGTEYSKMRKIAPRLIEAGLDTSLI